MPSQATYAPIPARQHRESVKAAVASTATGLVLVRRDGAGVAYGRAGDRLVDGHFLAA